MTDHIQTDARLLISVVRRGRGNYVAQVARNAGAPGGTILFGRGTARGGILGFLCLADTEKELVFTLAPASVMQNIVHALRNDPMLCRKAPGIGFVIDAPVFIRPGHVENAPLETDNTREKKMSVERELICVVVNSGLADDVMHAARDAGASGGTILRARGTATGNDASFFGITIVPEKEMLMVLTEKTASSAILAAIANTPCLSEPGCGIAFCLPVIDFFPLGLKSQDKHPG